MPDATERLLQAARLGAYTTSALVLFAVLLLSYAFVSHDFRIRYVAHYSDRRMSTAYLLTALWGGSPGSKNGEMGSPRAPRQLHFHDGWPPIGPFVYRKIVCPKERGIPKVT